MSTLAAILGRILLAAIFVISGINKLLDPAATAQMLESVSLPANFAQGVGIFEVAAGLLLAIGLMTRLVSIVLAGFTLLTIFFFHNQWGDPVQVSAALKNLAITGGLLLTFAYGQMRGSYDHIRSEKRLHDANLRAAHAEGVAEGATQAPRPVVVERHESTIVDRDLDHDGDGRIG